MEREGGARSRFRIARYRRRLCLQGRSCPRRSQLSSPSPKRMLASHGLPSRSARPRSFSFPVIPAPLSRRGFVSWHRLQHLAHLTMVQVVLSFASAGIIAGEMEALQQRHGIAAGIHAKAEGSAVPRPLRCNGGDIDAISDNLHRLVPKSLCKRVKNKLNLRTGFYSFCRLLPLLA